MDFMSFWKKRRKGTAVVNDHAYLAEAFDETGIILSKMLGNTLAWDLAFRLLDTGDATTIFD